MLLTTTGFCEWISKYLQRLRSIEDLLNDLDNRIGDGDHGTNMVRGFSHAVDQLAKNQSTDLSTAASTVGMALIAKVGGASGPLYGTGFLKLSTAWKALSEADVHAVRDGLKLALQGIQSRGKAELGDKTMVDVWDAFLQRLDERNFDDGTLQEAAGSGTRAAIQTKDLVARRGRAAYLGERSRGVADPGSVSSALLFEQLVNAIVGGVEETQWQLSALC